MRLIRQNILELVNKGKYTSCLITTYNFDFNFFEGRVLPYFRAAGIKNVNVFLDEVQLTEAINNSHYIKSGRSYSINPVKVESGVFHPKILLFLGKDSGLLFIGSGNLTLSGMGYNDEIWSAFHIDLNNQLNSPIFLAAAQYFRKFAIDNSDIDQQKIEWAFDSAPWLDTSKKLNRDKWIENKNLEVITINNTKNESIFSRLDLWLQDEEVHSITVCSPFYDAKGTVLQELLTTYNPARFDVLCDSAYNKLPTALPRKILSKISFYDSQLCIGGSLNGSSKHAKLFHFKVKDGEYLILGSANATSAGFGRLDGKSKNHELCVALYREGKGNFLRDLDINVKPENSFNLSEFTVPEKLMDGPDLITPLGKFNLEVIRDQLILKYPLPLNDDITLRLIFENIDDYKDVNIHIADGLWHGKNEDSPAVTRAQLFSDNSPISKIILVDHVEKMARSNPSVEKARLSSLILELEEGSNLNYLELLNYVKFLDLEKESDSRVMSKALSIKNSNDLVATSSQETEISPEEFKKLNSKERFQLQLVSNPNFIISDILAAISSGLFGKKASLNDEDEMINHSELDYDLGSDRPKPKNPEFANLESLANKEKLIKDLNNFFYRFYMYDYQKIEPFFENGNLRKIGICHATFGDLGRLDVFVYLLYLHKDLTFPYHYSSISLDYYPEKLLKRQSELKRLEAKDEVLSKDGVQFHKLSVRKERVNDLRRLLKSIGASMPENQLIESWVEYENILADGVAYYKRSSNEWIISGIKEELILSLGVYFLTNQNQFKTEPSLEEANVRFEVLARIIFLCCSMNWSEKELIFQDLVLLNSVHWLIPKKFDESDIERLSQALAKLQRSKTKSLSTDILSSHNFKFSKSLANMERINDNFKLFIARVLTPYSSWFQEYQVNPIARHVEVSQLMPGSIIYKKNLGFVQFVKARKNMLFVNMIGNEHLEALDKGFEIEYHFSKISSFSTLNY